MKVKYFGFTRKLQHIHQNFRELDASDQCLTRLTLFHLGSCSTRGALGALMACLRTARAHGYLQFTDMMHDSLVSSGCIKQGLVHQHDEVLVLVSVEILHTDSTQVMDL